MESILKGKIWGIIKETFLNIASHIHFKAKKVKQKKKSAYIPGPETLNANDPCPEREL